MTNDPSTDQPSLPYGQPSHSQHGQPHPATSYELGQAALKKPNGLMRFVVPAVMLVVGLGAGMGVGTAMAPKPVEISVPGPTVLQVPQSCHDALTQADQTLLDMKEFSEALLEGMKSTMNDDPIAENRANERIQSSGAKAVTSIESYGLKRDGCKAAG